MIAATEHTGSRPDNLDHILDRMLENIVDEARETC